MQRPRLLVVDDDFYTQQALTTLFTRRGWVVGVASTVAEGLSGAGPSRPRFVILDLNLPDGGGESVLREVRLRPPGDAGRGLLGLADPPSSPRSAALGPS